MIRPSVPDDRPFIVDTLLESFRKSFAAGPLPPDIYRPAYRRAINRILDRPTERTLVLETEGVLIGWISYERRTPVHLLHYCYTKKDYRREGVARELMRKAGIDPKQPFYVTFWSPKTDELRDAGAWSGARWNPAIVRKGDTRGQVVERRIHRGQGAVVSGPLERARDSDVVV